MLRREKQQQLRSLCMSDSELGIMRNVSVKIRIVLGFSGCQTEINFISGFHLLLDRRERDGIFLRRPAHWKILSGCGRSVRFAEAKSSMGMVICSAVSPVDWPSKI